MGTEPRTQDGPEGASSSFRKISKPLMEKKRRARINRCLEQLRALLEKHYSHQIRKRKLEKADILELSVKYMKSLQSSAQGLWPLPSAADYVSGLRGCPPGGVHPLLPRREEAGGGPRCPLAHGCAGGSTMDSAGAGAPARWGPAPAAGGSRAPPARLPSALPGAPAPPPAPVRCSGSPGPGQCVWRPW